MESRLIQMVLKKASDGSSKLKEGTDQLEEGTKELMKAFDMETSNLTQIFKGRRQHKNWSSGR
mgnify:CR=1 FL=1